MSSGPPKRSWANANSQKVLHSYDKSPVESPTQSPSVSRRGSSSSVKSTQSEPHFLTDRRKSSEPTYPNTGSLRRESHTPQASAADSQKKSGFKGIFSKKTAEEKEAEKRKKKWDNAKQSLEFQKYMAEAHNRTSRKIYEIEARKNKESPRPHPRPDVKTAGISDYTSHGGLSAAAQEARYPHSGRPSLAINGNPKDPLELSRIESQDQPDDEVDMWQKSRDEWHRTHEDNLDDINEIRSRQGSRISSPFASPGASREPSPNRLWSARPSIGAKRNSWQAYSKDPVTGRWSKRSTPPQKSSGGLTPMYPPVQHGGVDPDLLTKSLAERLNVSS